MHDLGHPKQIVRNKSTHAHTRTRSSCLILKKKRHAMRRAVEYINMQVIKNMGKSGGLEGGGQKKNSPHKHNNLSVEE